MRVAGFRRFWLASAVSMVGDQVSLVALPLVAVTTLRATPAELGLLAAVAGVPLLMFGLPVGAWVDQVRRRRLLVGADLARAAVLAAVPLAALAGVLSLPLLVGVAFATAALAVVYNIAATAYLPSLLPPNRLVAGNARLTQARAVTQVAGPGVAGALVQLLTAPFAVLLDAVSYLLSALFIRGIDADETPVARADRKLAAGVAMVWRDRLLRASALSAGTYTFFNAAILALLVLYLARNLQLTPAQLGLVLAAAGPGSLLGAALAVRVSNSFGLGPTMIAGLVTAGLANVAIPLAASPVLIGAAMLVNGAAQPLYNINQSSLRQAIVPAHLQGRVTATMTVLAGGAAPLGAFAGGQLAQAVGVRPTLLVAALGTVAACVWPLCSPIRRLRSVPTPP